MGKFNLNIYVLESILYARHHGKHPPMLEWKYKNSAGIFKNLPQDSHSSRYGGTQMQRNCWILGGLGLGITTFRRRKPTGDNSKQDSGSMTALTFLESLFVNPDMDLCSFK